MISIEHDRDKRRFKAMHSGQEVGYLTYDLGDHMLNITHTVVTPVMRGQGIAKQLVLECKSFADSESLTVKSDCSYASSVLGLEVKNPSCKI